MASSLGIGIVGLGFGRSAHLPAFRADSRCQVVSLCGRRFEQTREIAQKEGIEGFTTDWRELVSNPLVQAVSIATPPGLQAEIAMAALKAGKAVFCEKPLAQTLQQAVELAQFAQQSGLANMVDFEFEESPQLQDAKRILEEGKLGSIRHVSLSWNSEIYAIKMGLDSWKVDENQGGGVLNSFVSHSAHYLEWLFGPIQSISASLYGQGPRSQDAETLCLLSLETRSGIPIAVTVSAHAFLGTGHRMEVYGEKGSFILSNSSRDFIGGFELKLGLREKDQAFQIISPASELSGDDGRTRAVGRLVNRFVTWVVDGKPSQPDFSDGLRVQYLLDRVRKSNETRERVICE